MKFLGGNQFNGGERGLRFRLVEFEMPVMSSKQLHMLGWGTVERWVLEIEFSGSLACECRMKPWK